MDGHADATEQVAIAKLEPTIPNLQSCYFKAVVTLIWPYSSSNKSLSVLLAEPDFLLRRSRGQVKVQFAGSSAKHVFDAGIGSGDELVVSLNGAEWIPESASAAQTPGRGIEWELKFAERLVLQIRQRESGNIALLNLDNPPQESEPVRVAEIEAPVENPSPPPGSPIPTARHDQLRSEETGEWSSPAFIKRARLSYGSFIGKDFEAFIEDDGSIPGKGRKRSRFGRKSGDWRYISRSPSPEEEVEVEDPVVEQPPPEKEKPKMTDEGCQTDGLEYSEEMQEFFRQSQAAGREARLSGPPGLQDTRMEFAEDQVNRQPVPSFDAFPSGNEQPASHAIEANGSAAQWPESIFRDMGFSNGSLPDMNLRPSLPFEQPASHSPQNPPTSSIFGNYQEDGRNGPFHAPYPPDQPMELQHGLPLETGHHYGEHLNEAPEEPRDSAAPQFAQPAQSLYPELPDVSMETPAQPAWESLTHVPGATAPSTFEVPDATSREASAPRYSQPSTPKYRLNELGQVVPIDEGEEESEGESEEGEEEAEHHEIGSDEEMGEESGEESGEEIEVESRQAPEQHYRQPQFPNEQAGVATEQRYSNERDESELDEEDHPSEGQEFSDDDEGSEVDSGDEALYAQEGEEFEEGEDFDEEDDQRYDDEEMSEEDLGPVYQQQQQQPAAKAEPVFIDLLSSDDEEEQPKPEPKPPLVHKESNFADVEDNVQDNVIEDEEVDEDAEGEYEGESEEEEIAVGRRDDEESEESESEGSESPELEDQEPSDVTEVGQPFTPQATQVQNEVEMQQAPAITTQPDQFKPDNANLSMVEEVGGYEDEDDTMERGLAEQRFMDGANDLPADSGIVKEKTPTSTAVEDVQVESGDEEDTEGGVAPSQTVEMEVDQEVQIPEAVNVRASLDEQLQAKQFEDELRDDEQLEEEQLEEEELEEELEHKDTSLAETREDVSLAEVTYPSLPLDESSIIETEKEPLDEPQEEEADDDDMELINAQLMTPDATQISSTLPQDASFTAPAEKQLQDDTTAEKVVADEIVHNSVEDTEPIKETTAGITKRVTRSAKATADTLQPPVTPTTDKRMSLRSATSPISTRTDRSPSLAVSAPRTRKDSSATAHLSPEAPKPSEKRQPSPQPPKHNLRSKPSTSPISARITRSQDRTEAPATPNVPAAILPPATKDLKPPPKELPTTPQKATAPPLSETALRASLTKALRTNLSDFTPLKVLRHNLGKRLDVLAIATTAPPEAQRAKHGPRHYHLRFNVTDPSIAPTGVVEIQVFRPYKEALPDVEVGDGVLLRNFSVKAEKDKGFALRSEDSSSWAVFKRDRVTECRGPPVEIGESEEEHVARLKEWWGSRGEEFMARLERVGESPGSARGKTKAKGA
ncbi:hypothetical protein V494_01507 [Pseudogymnoascus sp. VKM F-4513 (FW-928)]|nr:hypothetical protein V494_01507 [Pseudogymnoascus sp. VKM F-4513 (FW-928)]